MLFNSFQFLLFLLIVRILYGLLKRHRAQNTLLLLASYLFYGAWDWRFLFLILASTLVDYQAARKMADEASPTRRHWLILSLCFNLGMLGFFKYWGFGIESFAALLSVAGFTPHLPTLSVILPVGISFYTFQTIGYTVDVYRGKTPPCQNFFDFALYVAFFPQLVAGPIERSTHLLPRLQRQRIITAEDWKIGFHWILLGYFKKVVIADTIAPLVDEAFAQPDQFSGIVSLFAIFGFALQIYGDFAGYSLIARGVSRWFGIDLMRNFKAPFLARSPRDFWARWHISLSEWLRDYLYIPLGGNRSSPWLNARNLFLTLLLGGLWHGAAWNFVIWGAYNGGVLLLARTLCWTQKASHSLSKDLPLILITLVFTMLGWLFFRTSGWDNIAAIVHNIGFNFHWDAQAQLYVITVGTMSTLLLAYHIWQERSGEFALLEAPLLIRVTVITFLLSTIIAVGFRPTPFIYFQF